MGRGRRIAHQNHPVIPTAAGDQPVAGNPPQAGAAAGAGVGVDRAAAAAVAGDLADEHQASLDAARQARERQAEELARANPFSYVEHPQEFEEVYDRARAEILAGRNPVPFMTEDATGGLGARGTGRGFGVEIEFDFPAEMTAQEQYEALVAIGRDLYAEGLTNSRQQAGYHAALEDGYTTAPNSWSFEDDSTVAGEIVSPIMYDEPESWENLAKVTEIVRRHGGIATERTGGHVHVGLHDYDHTVENHNRLLQTAAAYEDVLFRLATNPESGEHRGTSWCVPNQVPTEGYTTILDAQYENFGHEVAVNLQHVTGDRSDHAEFRMWDGSLDPAVIQTQVKVSLALADYALRSARTPGALLALDGERQPLGHHRRLLGRLRPSGEAWREATSSFRDMADRLFTRPQDREQAAALFAATSWQVPA